jgi:hypothetical protein
MNTVLLEFPDEADSFLAYCKVQDMPLQRFHIIALWPSVQVALTERGVTYTNTLPYFRNESHRRILHLSEEWLKIVESGIRLEDGSPIRQSFNEVFVFQLRFYLNYFLWVLEVLRNLVRQHDVTSFLVAETPPSSVKKSGPNLEPTDRYLSHIVRAFGGKHGIRVEEFAPEVPKASRRRAAIPRILRQAGERALGNVSAGLHHISLRMLRSKPTILVNALSYNMDRLAAELKQMFPDVRILWLQTTPVHPGRALFNLMRHRPADCFLSLGALQSPLGDIRETEERMAHSLEATRGLLHGDWQESLEYEGVSFVDVFAPKIENDLFAHMRGLVGRSQAIHGTLKQVKPALVISPMSAWADAVLGEWTRILGITSLSVSHGTFTPPTTREDEIEAYRLGTSIILTTYQHTAIQSPWAERYLAHFNGGRRPTPVKTGSLIFAKLDPTLRAAVRRELLGEAATDRTKVIVYATTLKPRSGLRFHIHETLDEHLSGIADLARVVRKLDNAVLIVKLHPAAALKEEEVRLLVPETNSDRVRVLCRVPFARVLAAADLVVSFSSTCIEEGIQNRLPVLLYDPWSRYQHLSALRWGQEEPKSSPAYYVGEDKSLEPALRWILMHHDPADVSETTWAEHVCPPEMRGEFVRFVSNALHVPPRDRQGIPV